MENVKILIFKKNLRTLKFHLHYLSLKTNKKYYLIYIYRHIFEMCMEWNSQHIIQIEVTALGWELRSSQDCSRQELVEQDWIKFHRFLNF